MTQTLRFRASVYEGQLRQPPHAHDHPQISLVLSGRLRESVRGTDVLAGSLSVVVKDTGVMHEDEFGPGRVAVAQLSLPGGSLRDLMGTGDRTPVWHWSHHVSVASPFMRLVTRAACGATMFASDDTDVVDVLAAITSRPQTATRGAPPRWLCDARDDLRETWRAGTRVSDVATRIGVHPVYLARCFRRWYGHSVSDELRMLRQRAATDAIVAGQHTLSAVAHAAGYADEAHLNREFRNMCGVAPGRFRRLLGNVDFQDWTSGCNKRLRGFKSGRL